MTHHDEKSTVVTELRHLIGQVARTTQEKYQLLEQRDKILRKTRVKVSDVHHAAVFKGTCPDMCPEKERYRREVQKLLHPFELVYLPDVGVDHYKAVKDYSRSSADQEEPLPHDLRSSDVLERTMNYLIGAIAVDVPEESQLIMWYDFLWNRTRAIRKDITQQMLNDKIAVALIEKCVRFHIFAAYRLCELDRGDFDQKMNTENLTKCLLSLRHMYDDLSKANIDCENEAEFRCYYVLLNLNDTNILRQVLTYKESVRHSPLIRLALKLFSAMQSNNYVRFFRLIREKATFLQSCLVHRYFLQVRIDALKIIVKAYGSGGPQIPLTDVVKFLSFEDLDEAKMFLVHFGLTLVDNSILNLSRFSYVMEQDQDPSMKRAKLLIESKLSTSLGEVINGGPLSEVVVIHPVISFDADNRYVNDEVIAAYVQGVEEKRFNDEQHSNNSIEHQHSFASHANSKMFPIFKPHLREQPKFELPETLVNDLFNDFFIARVNMEIEKTVVDVTSNKIYLKLISTEISRQVKNSYEEKKQVEARKCEKQKRLNFVDEIAVDIRDGIVQELCNEVIPKIVRQQLNDLTKVFNETVRKLVDGLTYEIHSEFLLEFLSKEIRTVAADVFRSEVTERFVRLDEIRLNLTLLNVRKCFAHWMKKTRRKKSRLDLLANFPVFPGLVNYEHSSPPKKIRLSTFRDCPTPTCCCCSNVTSAAETRMPPLANGLVAEENSTSSSSADLEESVAQEAATREVRDLLESLKRGIEREKIEMQKHGKAVLNG